MGTATINLRDVVRDVAEKLFLLDPHGELVPLDSLTLVDFVGNLERTTGLVVPTSAITEEAFASIERVASLLVSIQGNGS
jgi:acyl carrier protein